MTQLELKNLTHRQTAEMNNQINTTITEMNNQTNTNTTLVEPLKFQVSNNICEYVGNIQLTLIENRDVTDYKDFEFITLEDMITFIKTGIIETMETYDIREKITKIRKYEQLILSNVDPKANKEAKNNLKAKLPAYLFMAGDWNGFKREDQFVVHNQLQFIDIDDGITEEKMTLVRELLGDSLIAEWNSSSGNGKGMVIYVKKMSKEEYTRSYTILSNFILAKTGLQIDKSCKNVSRLTYASWDTEIVYNLYNRVEFVHDESYANDINIVCNNTQYTPNNKPLNREILKEAYDFLYNLPEEERIIRHTETDSSYDNKFSLISACTYATYDKHKTDEDNALATYTVFMSLFGKQERADLTNYAIKSSDEDEDTYNKILGLLRGKNTNKWKEHYDGGTRFLNIAIIKGFRGSAFEVKKHNTNLDILKNTYTDYISTPEVIKYIKENCLNQGKYTYVVAPTGTGKTKIIIETALYLHAQGQQVIIVNPSADCTLQLVHDINKAANYECAYALVGKENSTREDDENKSIPQKFRDNVNQKIIVATQSAIAFLYDIGYELVKQYIDANNPIIFDEAHTITSDADPTYRSSVCTKMYQLIDLIKPNCPIMAYSATPTEYDDLVWGDFDKLDFRKLVKFTNKVNVHIVHSKNTDEKMQNLFKIASDAVNNKGKCIIRLNSTEKITLIKQKLIDSKLFRDNSIVCLHAKNRTDDENIAILDTLHTHSLINEQCDIFLTTSIIDTSLNILNENVTYIYIDSAKDTPETITQAISRVRNAKDVYILAINKEDNSINIQAKQRTVNKNYFSYKDTIDKVISQVHLADIDKKSYINRELDNLITLEGGVKYCNKTALAWKLNNKFTALLNTPEKITFIADKYRNNFIINDTYVAKDVTINQEEFAITFNETLKEKIIENKANNRQIVEDLILVATHKDDFFLQCYIQGLVSDECADILNLKIDNVNKERYNKGRYVDTELKRVNSLMNYYGFLDWEEAVRFSFDTSNDIFGDIKVLKELIHICVGKTYHNPFQSINTKEVFHTYTLVCLFANKLCNENMVLTVTQLKEELIKFLKLQDTSFNITDFNSIVKKILDLIPYVTEFDNIRTKDSEGKTIRQKKFIRIKSVAEIIQTYYDLLKSKGVTKVKSIDILINPEIQHTLENVVNIAKATVHDFEVNWGDTSFNVSLFLEA